MYLLMIIATQEELRRNKIPKAVFDCARKKKNFLILMAFYLVMVIAKRIHPFLDGVITKH